MSSNSTLLAPSLLVIDKPAGMTSHDVVAHLRRLTGVRQAGHTGTLDPFATGLLLILLGSGTRLMEYTHTVPKTYQATVVLGTSSTTDDPTGTLTSRDVSQQIERSDIERVLPQFIGTIRQLPPTYAAIKVQGKKLYQYARAGEAVPRLPRDVQIFSIALQSYHYPELTFTVQCGSGTYIRALGRDIGQALGTGGYVSVLRRTQIGSLTADQATPLAQLTLENWRQYVAPVTPLLTHLPHLTLPAPNVAQLRQGRAISLETAATAQPLVLLDEHGQLVGIGHYDQGAGKLLPRKIF